MASFIIAYKNFVEPWEGGFADIAADKGGLTYAGITEKNFPSWEGWPLIKSKMKAGKIKNNTKFPELNFAVKAFYEKMWNDNKFGFITSQDVANIVFDFFVNSGFSAIKSVQRILGLSTDGKLGEKTLSAINARNPSTLNDQIKKARIEFYNSIVRRDPSQNVFIKGWMKRINSFPTLTKVSAGLVLILCLFFIYLLINYKP
jgi:lysozyme family protein